MIRESVFLRYSLIHELYTLFHEYTVTGIPIVRPLFVEFPEDLTLENIAHEFMFGGNILVAPKLARFSDGRCKDEKECSTDVRYAEYFAHQRIWRSLYSLN